MTAAESVPHRHLPLLRSIYGRIAQRAPRTHSTIMSERPQNLQALFAAAKERKRELESSLETNSDSYRDKVNATIADFEECQKLIRELSLFSSNEGVEDIATADLQYDWNAEGLIAICG